jgi:hypothetical protein
MYGMAVHAYNVTYHHLQVDIQRSNEWNHQKTWCLGSKSGNCMMG